MATSTASRSRAGRRFIGAEPARVAAVPGARLRGGGAGDRQRDSVAAAEAERVKRPVDDLGVTLAAEVERLRLLAHRRSVGAARARKRAEMWRLRWEQEHQRRVAVEQALLRVAREPAP